MCIYTKYIVNPKYRPNKKNYGKPPKCDDMRKYYVPVKCGHCIECRKQKQREWVIRLSEEIRNHTMKFVTLTINEEYMAKLKTSDESPNDIATRALRLFLERVRKETKKSIRHWCVTELGDDKGRIHLHGFFECRAETIAKHWKYGFIFVGRWVNEQSIFYMTKYMLKECPYDKHFVGKVLCSKGIGSGYTRRLDAKRNRYQPNKTKETYRLRDGREMALPQYYRMKLYSEEERDKLWIEKQERGYRYIMGEKISTENEEEWENAVKYWQGISQQVFKDNPEDWEIAKEKRKLEKMKRYRRERRNRLSPGDARRPQTTPQKIKRGEPTPEAQRTGSGVSGAPCRFRQNQ